METNTATQFKTTTLNRTINAPRELIFDAFLNPEHLTKWHHADGGWYTPFANIDARPGGELAIGFSSADNSMQFTLGGKFDEIRKNEYISYTMEDGRQVRITLTDAPNNATNVNWEFGLENMNSEEMQRTGWGQMLKNLDVYMVREAMAKDSKEAVVIERVFNAPRQLVWDAWTKAEMMQKWWGPRSFSSPVTKIDARVGGTWLASMREEKSGFENYCGGRFLYLDPISQLVFTNGFLLPDGTQTTGAHYGMPSVTTIEMLVTVDLQDMGEKTRMIMRHEGLPASEVANATAGWGESLDKLEESLH